MLVCPHVVSHDGLCRCTLCPLLGREAHHPCVVEGSQAVLFAGTPLTRTQPRPSWATNTAASNGAATTPALRSTTSGLGKLSTSIDKLASALYGKPRAAMQSVADAQHEVNRMRVEIGLPKVTTQSEAGLLAAVEEARATVGC